MKQKALKKKESVSDFEHSYAANVAPRYLTHRRTILSRIPGPAQFSTESRDSSRRPSPDKRPTMSKHGTEGTVRGFRPASPPPPSTVRGSKPRIVSRTNPGKERVSLPRTLSGHAKGTVRKPTLNSGMVGSKVSNIARHFERIHRDNEKANRRYAVIRGRRARPVASARATVEVFDSVKEALKDESESSDSQSEADDEDDGDAEGDESVENKQKQNNEADRDATSEAICTPSDAPSKVSIDATVNPPDETGRTGTSSGYLLQEAASAEVSPSALLSQPTSPLSNTAPVQTPSEISIASDMESSQALGDRQSTIMKALSGFWPQPTISRHPLDLEGDDPMADPEHIFRESSMVVRTDEPTSIIALALKYAIFCHKPLFPTNYLTAHRSIAIC